MTADAPCPDCGAPYSPSMMGRPAKTWACGSGSSTADAPAHRSWACQRIAELQLTPTGLTAVLMPTPDWDALLELAESDPDELLSCEPHTYGRAVEAIKVVRAIVHSVPSGEQ